jgi:hypothetical protein
VGSELLLRLLLDQRFRFGYHGRLEIEEMLLACSFNNPFSTAPMDPSLQSVEFVKRCLVLLFQFFMGGSGLIQYATEFRHLPLGIDNATLTLCGLLESRQQETLALGKIVGKLVGVIHNAPYFSESLNLRKATSPKKIN